MLSKLVVVGCAVASVVAQYNQYGQYNQNPYQGGGAAAPEFYNGNTPDCGNGECVGKAVMCGDNACTFDCNEPGACRGATFYSSPITESLEVQCKKIGACAGMRVISGALNTKVQCDDHSCTGVKMHCVALGMAQKCEFQCQNDGCLPMQAAYGTYPGMPAPVMPAASPNEVLCQGNIRECIVKVQQERSFINGNFTCAVGPMGRCLMECADSRGEISCRGSTYMCKSLNPSACQCKDTISAPSGFPVMNPLFPLAPLPNPNPIVNPLPRIPGMPNLNTLAMSTRDCPPLSFPKPKVTTTKGPKTTVGATTTQKPATTV